ncbi:MAG: sel1 repeat family protein [Candidatus Methanomethylophilus sp.]|nr:sel1 repeat family protein [Methanomethylophilus sp.]
MNTDPEYLYQEALDLIEKEEYSEAADRLKIASKQNHIRALVELGSLYITGDGVPCSPKDAFACFRSAAEQGDSEAMCYLGRMYLNGDGTEQSDRKAFKWLSEAKDKGETDALSCLGFMYHEGKGCEKDIDKALECYVGAAEGGDPEGPYNAASVYLEKGDYSNAAKYFEMGAEDGDPGCMAELGLLYRDGKGVERSGDKAAELFDRAYQEGNPDGLFYKSTLFFNMIGMVWEAADNGSTKALNQLASQFRDDPAKVERLERTYKRLLESDPDVQSDYREFKRILGQ